MKIGVLGSGDVAKSLATGFLSHGHEVVVGSRTAAKLDDWKRKNSGGRTGSFAGAAAFGEVVVLAVKGSVAAEALRMAGPEHLAGKTVIDATNPIAEAAPSTACCAFSRI